jgi:alpha-L-arabinofuranosidase
VSARIQAGHAEPYDVKVFEIGNEVYGFWNTGSADGAYSFANPRAVNGGDPAWDGNVVVPDCPHA